MTTDEKRYSTWKGIIFDNGTYFSFSKEKLFSEVTLSFPYSNRKEFDDFIAKIESILGDKYFFDKKDNFEMWVGKNIRIILNLEYKEESSRYKWVYLSIGSKSIQTQLEKDY